MNQHYTYFLILGLSIAGPLALSFDKKVGFYKKWRYVFPAMILPAIFFIIWDTYFTKLGVWSFNDDYITGYKLSFLPVEEVLFFFIVPYCCIFIYECIRRYFPGIQDNRRARIIMFILAAGLLITSILFYDRDYTFWTFVFTSIVLVVVLGLRSLFTTINASLFLISYLVILLPFLAVNGVLTSIPIVIYNNGENLGFRLFSIPFEDIFYGMLLFLMNIIIYENLLTRSRK
jgi:lycopene cyclase domain-containing protein